jgi:DNA-binding IclR family transcriptional regulator
MQERRPDIRNTAVPAGSTPRATRARPASDPTAQRSLAPATPAAATTTIEKAIDLLFYLHATGAARGVSEIGRALGVPKSSAHRLLASLVRRGLVEQDDNGRYRPGIALLALGLGALEREPLAAAARPILERESEATGETAFLTVAKRGRIYVLDKSEGASFLRVAPSIGSEVPVHATAVGKLHLAFAPESVVLGKEPWPGFTEATPVHRAELERNVERARRRGWAENRDGWIPGLTVVAAPVLVASRMHGCFVIAAPSSRVGEADLARLAKRVQRAAGDIAARLQLQENGHRPARA